VSDRRRRRALGDQLSVLWALVPIWFAGVVLLAFVSTASDSQVKRLLLDPADELRIEWYAGLVTHLSTFGWTVASVASAGGAWVASQAGRRGAARFLGWGAALGAWLVFDEVLQLHSVAIPRFAGASKTDVEAVLILATGLWVVVFRVEVLRTRWVLLVIAEVTLGMSALLDLVAPFASDRADLLAEDGAKFLGVLAWATYFVVTAADVVRSVMSEHSSADDVQGAPGAEPLDVLG